LCDFRLKFSQDECRALFDSFDENDDGVLDFDELLRALKGQMNSNRKEMIKKAYAKIDYNGNGCLEIDDVRQSYNASNHPDVKSGKRTDDEILQEFLETFEANRQMSKELR
jgi:Ca2+-binding EF-hand superfamily protein